MKDGRNRYGRCPFCNKKLGKLTQEYANKHINRCGRRLNPYQYSDRARGRPTKTEIEEYLRRRDSDDRKDEC